MTNHSQAQLPLGSELDSSIGRIFTPLCQPLAAEDAADLQAAMHAYVDAIHQALNHNEFLDVEIATRIAATLDALFAGYARFSAENRALIIGAARYFIAADDAEHDTHSILGFDDDLTVLNHVTARLNRPDLHINL